MISFIIGLVLGAVVAMTIAGEFIRRATKKAAAEGKIAKRHADAVLDPGKALKNVNVKQQLKKQFRR